MMIRKHFKRAYNRLAKIILTTKRFIVLRKYL
jgi:hypothetical protein